MSRPNRPDARSRVAAPALAALIAVTALMPDAPVRSGSVDLLGSVTVTVGVAAAVYGIVPGPEVGWASG
ncbi:hypothetical protein [Nocardia asiatica]|uniref:hypothetical protein n=1 Tax=Nocardia asiatica TaxID=209252 RepID=UPI0005C22085|nr:hypothetical protein [Nocardia asiatica]